MATRKKILKQSLQIILFMTLGIALIVWRYHEMSDQDKMIMVTSFQKIKKLPLVLIFIVILFSHIARALRWKLLLAVVGKDSKPVNLLGAVLIGYLANSLVPRWGEIAKCGVLYKYDRTPTDKAIGTIIAERMFDTLCLLIILLLTLVFMQDKAVVLFQQYITPIFVDSSGHFPTIKILFLILCLFLFMGLVYMIYKRLQSRKLKSIIKNLIQGVRSILLVEKKLLFLIYTLLIWLFYISIIAIAFHTLPETSPLGFATALAIVTFGSFGMIITPGGIGAYPIIVAGILSLYDINGGVGLAFGWICWGIQTLTIWTLGLLSLILLPIYNNNEQTAINS